ncbi:MAG: selenide, water dikinase SelD, partial [Hyphomicrobiaceae bacterium]
AGHYDLDACHIDIVRLAHFAGARVIHGEAVGIDVERKHVHILGRPPLSYNLLSLDTGITPAIDDIRGAAEHSIAVKPVSSFAPRWDQLRVKALSPGGPRRLCVIGTGAAGFELVLAIRHRLRAEAKAHGIEPEDFSFALIGSAGLLPTHNARARRLAADALAAAGIEVVLGDAAVAISPDAVTLASGRVVPSDATLVTTKAAPAAWFADTGLELDDRGYLAVRSTLQLVGHDDIFAAGDCAAVIEHPREKAGVFAVRQGPPLTRNLRLRLRGAPAEPFRPQRQFLTILSCGDRTAIAARGALAGAGGWAWRLKDRIDRSFMRKFQELPGAMGAAALGSDDMLCAGCAAKLGPASLANALARFASTDGAAAGAGGVRSLLPADDAAVLDLGGDTLRLESIDQFPAIWPEPYVLGAIAAAHALGDIHAKGGRGEHALAIAGVPPAAPHLQEDDLFQMLAGARSVLAPEGVTLVGGHTARSETMSVGFFVAGTVKRGEVLPKGGLVAGQAILLTKSLGTGLLFAGWMRRLARAREVSAALAGMVRSNAVAARILAAHGATGMSDVTGFGLAGHLIEMLEASGVSARLWLDACPLYPGVDRLLALGVRSSLVPDNLALSDRIDIGRDVEADAEAALALLFDPQTSGGLVAGLPASCAAAALAELTSAGVQAAMIGSTNAVAGETGQPRLEIVRRAPHAAETTASEVE